MWLRLRNVEKKRVSPFLLLENSRPLSPPREPQTPFASLGTPDFLSTCLGIDSHPYMTTGKPIALTRWTFVSKVMSLLFNMLSRFVRAFLPRSKCPLTSQLQSPPAVILEPQKIKAVNVSIFYPYRRINAKRPRGCQLY